MTSSVCTPAISARLSPAYAASLSMSSVRSFALASATSRIIVGAGWGSPWGTDTLGNFRDGGHRVHGIEPTDMGRLANQRGIPTTIAFMGLNILLEGIPRGTVESATVLGFSRLRHPRET